MPTPSLAYSVMSEQVMEASVDKHIGEARGDVEGE